MASPIGYVPLGLVGFTDRDDYDPAATYMQNDLVHLGNAIWKCKVDETTGIDPEENANWTIFINSTTDLAGIMAVDGSGVLGSPGGIVVSQTLIDAIAQKVMASIPVSKIVSNLLATDPTTVLAGSMGKVLDDKIASLNSDIDKLNTSKADKTALIPIQSRMLDNGLEVSYGNKTLRLTIDKTKDNISVDNIVKSTGVTTRLQWDTAGTMQFTKYNGTAWELIKTLAP